MRGLVISRFKAAILAAAVSLFILSPGHSADRLAAADAPPTFGADEYDDGLGTLNESQFGYEDPDELEAMHNAEEQRQVEQEKTLMKLIEESRAATNKKKNAKLIGGILGAAAALAATLAIVWRFKFKKSQRQDSSFDDPPRGRNHEDGGDPLGDDDDSLPPS